jgi:hypothetical protein
MKFHIEYTPQLESLVRFIYHDKQRKGEITFVGTDYITVKLEYDHAGKTHRNFNFEGIEEFQVMSLNMLNIGIEAQV